jgi:beta-mannosidase
VSEHGSAAMALERGRLADFDPGTGVAAGAFRGDFDDASWLELTLPTDVHTALIDAGSIPEPYADANESAVAWVAGREWWYRCTFDQVGPRPTPTERVRLILYGLDTEVAIWLNGSPLGEHHSMFRPAELDVTELLDYDGPNVLSLRFANLVDAEIDGSDVSVRDAVRLRRRKMQVAFGWDISCILLTVGVWQPIELRREERAALGAPHFSTVHLDDRYRRAIVRVATEIDAFAPDDDAIDLAYELHAPDGQLVGRGSLARESGEDHASAYLVVERPQLWWTHDLGEPNLYRLAISLAVEGQVIATRQAQVGIRTLALDQSPDHDEPPSRFFRFVLNGRPLFARGANWVPEDLRLGVVTDATYRERLAQAAGANMNMIRVWGGGSYEQDAFYATCDELGLLIWHDFMFAGLPYPGDAEFLAECEAEARYQVARLRTHPSLALWCGNNEAHLNHDPQAGRALFGDVLPRVVAEEDSSTPYWPGSPYGGDGFNSHRDGDTHDWRGFHGSEAGAFGEEGRSDRSGPGRHWRRYASEIGRFVSEFGFASAATRSTIERWNSEDERDPLARAWQDRIRYVPGDSEVALFEEITGLPRGRGEWIDFTHLIQAEGLRFGIERFRERKPHCSGALLWQLNDCWPGFTWSIIDFDGHPKPAYDAVRRAFAPVLVTVKPLAGGQFELWLVNDSAQAIDDVIALRIQRFDGTVLSEQHFPVRSEPNSAAQLVRRFGWGRVVQPRSSYVTLESERGVFAPNHQLFANPRELELRPVELKLETRAVDERTVDVTLSADSFVLMAAIEHRQPGLLYDDNNLTLNPNRPQTIRARHPHDSVDPDRFATRILFDPWSLNGEGETSSADRVHIDGLTRS